MSGRMRRFCRYNVTVLRKRCIYPDPPSLSLLRNFRWRDLGPSNVIHSIRKQLVTHPNIFNSFGTFLEAWPFRSLKTLLQERMILTVDGDRQREMCSFEWLDAIGKERACPEFFDLGSAVECSGIHKSDKG